MPNIIFLLSVQDSASERDEDLEIIEFINSEGECRGRAVSLRMLVLCFRRDDERWS
jgi:hypothetical protein